MFGGCAGASDDGYSLSIHPTASTRDRPEDPVRTRIVKWGNSLGLRIPRAFAAEVGVADGSPVELSLEDGCLVIRTVAPAGWTLDGLLAGVTPENLHAAVETGHDVGRESW